MLELFKTRLRAAICARRTFSCILLLPDLIISQEKGTFLKLSDKHGLQYVAWSGHTGGTGRLTTFEFSELGVGQLCS